MRKSTKQTTSEIHATTVARLLNRNQHELAATIQVDLDVRDEDVFVVSQRLGSPSGPQPTDRPPGSERI